VGRGEKRALPGKKYRNWGTKKRNCRRRKRRLEKRSFPGRGQGSSGVQLRGRPRKKK